MRRRSRLYSPQPGGPQYANPLYYQPTQSAYHSQERCIINQMPNVFGEPFQKKRTKKKFKKAGVFPPFADPLIKKRQFL